MNTPITIAISACLLGKNTRYDGGSRPEPLLVAALGSSASLLPLCPEAECGFGIPREPMQLEGDPKNPRLMTITSRSDLTDRMRTWCDHRLKTLADQSLRGLILKSRSPSCGKEVAVHGAGNGKPAYSPGLFAGLAMERFPDLPVADEEELRDPERLKDFFLRITSGQQNTQENHR